MSGKQATRAGAQPGDKTLDDYRAEADALFVEARAACVESAPALFSHEDREEARRVRENKREGETEVSTPGEELRKVAWDVAYRCPAHEGEVRTLEQSAAVSACRRCRREADSMYEALLAAAESRGVQKAVAWLRERANAKRALLAQVEAMKPDSFAVATLNVIADELDELADALSASQGRE